MSRGDGRRLRQRRERSALPTRTSLSWKVHVGTHAMGLTQLSAPHRLAGSIGLR
jgi:hypothetical protein